MNRDLRKQLERVRKRYAESCLDLAEVRLLHFTKEWQKLRPRKSVTILFGMGTEFVTIDEQRSHPEDDKLIERCLDEVSEILDSYRIACPCDVRIPASKK